MVDIDEITRRLDQLERASAQDMEIINLRFERVEMQLEHIEKKIDMLAEQVSWICKVLSRRFAGMPDEKLGA